MIASLSGPSYVLAAGVRRLVIRIDVCGIPLAYYSMHPEGLWMHKLSHSESSGNHAVKIYAQCMNYRIYAKILNSLST